MSESQDIAWAVERNVFKHRVAAITLQEDRVLLCELPSLDYSFLPGGKVRFGENTEVAVRRELAEELGIDFPTTRLALIVENIYTAGGQLYHEVCFFYRVPWPTSLPESAVNDNTEKDHSFTWVAVDSLAKARFQPAELIPWLSKLDDTVQHIVLDRREGSQTIHAGR